ncbi:hypothetical protein JHFBIEKO_4808 [Methylobacterium mesophilicum]|uniref:BrnA antitoxin family protein n=1 Tax=Methylobacterium mesophilicum TaxID=39956 RepID=UPI001EE16861|nr:BrnA antitoxin family protein [Methylobacterium mesophilicum]GJE24336.1 hypothetical protein JHFBIEKO_4808 [Methylobacterium mesophilicum]
MHPINIRLPAAMIEALRAQAEAHNLPLAAHVRSQLAATIAKPHNILKGSIR